MKYYLPTDPKCPDIDGQIYINLLSWIIGK
jgi:hypothetical protein